MGTYIVDICTCIYPFMCLYTENGRFKAGFPSCNEMYMKDLSVERGKEGRKEGQMPAL